MADKLGEAYVEIRARMDKLEGDMKRGGKAVKEGLMDALSGLGSVIPFASMAAGFAAIGREFGLSTKAAQEQADADARVEAVLKATGGAAGQTAKQLRDHASALQESTGYADDAINNFQATLLTFRNVQGQVFTDATRLALDMSAVMGTDLHAAAVMLGKALNDPIKGLTALTRVGVSFSESQKKAIKDMVASGNVVGAQTEILKEFEKEFGGAAKRLAGTDHGKLRVAQAALGDMREELGNKFLPIQLKIVQAQKAFVGSLNMIMAAVYPVTKAMAMLSDATSGLTDYVGLATIAVIGLATAMPTIVSAIKAAMAGLTAFFAANPVTIWLVGIGLAIALIVSLVAWSSRLAPVQAALTRLVERFAEAWMHVEKALAPIFGDVAALAGTWDELLGLGIARVIDVVGEMMVTFAKLFRFIVENWRGIWEYMSLTVQLHVSRIVDVFRNIGEGVFKVFKKISEGILVLVAAMGLAVSAVSKLMRFDSDGAAADVARMRGIIVKFADGVKAMPNPFEDLFRPGKDTKKIEDRLGEVGRDLLAKLMAIWMEAPPKIKKDVAKAAGIESPDRKDKDVKGFFGPVELAKKLQEAMLKNSKTDKLLGAAEAGAAAGEAAVGHLGDIAAMMKKNPPLAVATA